MSKFAHSVLCCVAPSPLLPRLFDLITGHQIDLCVVCSFIKKIGKIKIQ